MSFPLFTYTCTCHTKPDKRSEELHITHRNLTFILSLFKKTDFIFNCVCVCSVCVYVCAVCVQCVYVCAVCVQFVCVQCVFYVCAVYVCTVYVCVCYVGDEK